MVFLDQFSESFGNVSIGRDTARDYQSFNIREFLNGSASFSHQNFGDRVFECSSYVFFEFLIFSLFITKFIEYSSFEARERKSKSLECSIGLGSLNPKA